MTEWKTYKEIPKYEISTDGDIRNKKTGRILKTSINDNGYKIVCLSDENKRCTKRVHRLVAEVFDDNNIDRNGLDVIHKDRNKLNNNLSNLVWGRRSDIVDQRSQKICCIETGEIFKSVTNASEVTGINRTTISKCVNNPYLSSREGYHFKQVD